MGPLFNAPGEYARSSIFSETSAETSESHGTIRAFTTADIYTWVSVIGDKTTLEEEHILFSKAARGSTI